MYSYILYSVLYFALIPPCTVEKYTIYSASYIVFAGDPSGRRPTATKCQQQRQRSHFPTPILLYYGSKSPRLPLYPLTNRLHHAVQFHGPAKRLPARPRPPLPRRHQYHRGPTSAKIQRFRGNSHSRPSGVVQHLRKVDYWICHVACWRNHRLRGYNRIHG